MPVLLSLVYLVLRFVLQLLLLSLSSEEFKELEIVVSWHEHAVVRRQVARPHVRPADRAFLAAASRLLPRASRRSFFVTIHFVAALGKHALQDAYLSRTQLRPIFSVFLCGYPKGVEGGQTCERL
jgi:hypothetical protein